MIYTSKYTSPLGTITLAGEDEFLTGLWFDGQRPPDRILTGDHLRGRFPALLQTKEWLDLYFSGSVPTSTPPLKYDSTPFRTLIYDILLTIPYGAVMTYGEIARIVAAHLDKPKMSAQAVGGAVGHNPISLIIPCHRVIGADGALTGYAGGVERKRWLLTMEKSVLLPC